MVPVLADIESRNKESIYNGREFSASEAKANTLSVFVVLRFVFVMVSTDQNRLLAQLRNCVSCLLMVLTPEWGESGPVSFVALLVHWVCRGFRRGKLACPDPNGSHVVSMMAKVELMCSLQLLLLGFSQSCSESSQQHPRSSFLTGDQTITSWRNQNRDYLALFRR